MEVVTNLGFSGTIGTPGGDGCEGVCCGMDICSFLAGSKREVGGFGLCWGLGSVLMGGGVGTIMGCWGLLGSLDDLE